MSALREVAISCRPHVVGLPTETRLALVYLPPYSPELNPIEKVWAYIKRNVLGNFYATTTQELKARLRSGWQRVRYIGLPQQLIAATST